MEELPPRQSRQSTLTPTHQIIHELLISEQIVKNQDVLDNWTDLIKDLQQKLSLHRDLEKEFQIFYKYIEELDKTDKQKHELKTQLYNDTKRMLNLRETKESFKPL